ncbi:MAG: HEAT repeat domain-containing protein [Endomicrobiales bacterium]|nr:HEAT repeat domain-containing protein [Endomicrobiales bacterium]
MVEQETIDHLIKTFRLAIANLRIYPPTSQIVMATVDTFYKTINNVLQENKSLSFAKLADKLLINSTEPKANDTHMAANMVIKLFDQKQIQSITFHSGLTKDELSNFLTNILKKKKEELPQFPHIALDQTVYVATVKGEETVVKISDSLKTSGGDIIGLIKSIRESYDMIDEIPDHNTREQLQEHLAQELARQDTTVLRDIFDRDLPPKIEQSGLKKRLLNSLSREKIQDIFGEIATWYEEIRKMEGSDFAAVEQLEKLKKFMHNVLIAPAAKEIPKQFFEDLLRKGLINELPEWFSKEPEKPTTIFEVEKLLEKPPVELLDKSTLDNLPQLVEKLCQIEYNELIVKLLEKLLENLKNTAPKIRLPAIRGILNIYNVLQSHGKENLLKYIELPVLETAKKETSSDVYYYLAELLRLRARQNLLYGDYDASFQIVDLLRKQLSQEIMPDQKIRNSAKDTLEQLMSDISEILITDLKSSNEKKHSNSMQMFAKFGSLAVEPLIKVVKGADDIRIIRLASIALKNLGEFAHNRFIEELNLGLTAEEIIRVIKSINDLGYEGVIEHLNVLLRHPDLNVKIAILNLLAAMNNNQSKSLLIDQLNDENYSVVAETAKILSDLKCKESVPRIVKILDSSKTPPKIQEQLCIFLGNLEDYRAVPVLIKKLKKIFVLFSQNRKDTDLVRMRAAWSLRKFAGQDIEESLTKAAKDTNNSIAKTAKESLDIIRQSTKSQ